MTVTQIRYPIAPTVEAIRGTLLDAATVGSDYAWQDGNDLFDSYNCMNFGSAAEFCAPNAKTFDQSAGWVSGIRFAAYGGVQCSTVGLDQSRMLSEVESAFAKGESTAVERALMEHRFVADTEIEPRWDAPTDITPVSGAVSPAVGIALLEGWAAGRYVGTPTLHIPRAVASLRASVDAIVWDGSMLRTALGSKVAAGGGYDFPNTGPTGADAAAGERWLYATGEVVVQSSEAIVRQAVAHETNSVFVLGERAYIVAVDCFAAAVRVTLTA